MDTTLTMNDFDESDSENGGIPKAVEASIKYVKIETLGDGNCLYNGIALALRDLIAEYGMSLFAEKTWKLLLTQFKNYHKDTKELKAFDNFTKEDLIFFILNESSVKVQIYLAPIIRKITCDIMLSKEIEQTAQKDSTYLEALMNVLENQFKESIGMTVKGVSDTLFLPYSRMREEFQKRTNEFKEKIIKKLKTEELNSKTTWFGKLIVKLKWSFSNYQNKKIQDDPRIWGNKELTDKSEEECNLKSLRSGIKRWWDLEGAASYFDQQSRNHNWGSDEEAKILAENLNLNLNMHMPQQSKEDFIFESVSGKKDENGNSRPIIRLDHHFNHWSYVQKVEEKRTDNPAAKIDKKPGESLDGEVQEMMKKISFLREKITLISSEAGKRLAGILSILETIIKSNSDNNGDKSSVILKLKKLLEWLSDDVQNNNAVAAASFVAKINMAHPYFASSIYHHDKFKKSGTLQVSNDGNESSLSWAELLEIFDKISKGIEANSQRYFGKLLSCAFFNSSASTTIDTKAAYQSALNASTGWSASITKYNH